MGEPVPGVGSGRWRRSSERQPDEGDGAGDEAAGYRGTKSQRRTNVAAVAGGLVITSPARCWAAAAFA
ncbi:MAG TPA: hypothetical protein VG795_10610, partial [Acidimicrobiia bacterium]|nr:hypothetical protein [Acidimicrobiia bacterium]